MELMEKGSLYNLIHDKTFALDGEILLPILRDVGKSLALPLDNDLNKPLNTSAIVGLFDSARGAIPACCRPTDCPFRSQGK